MASLQNNPAALATFNVNKGQQPLTWPPWPPLNTKAPAILPRLLVCNIEFLKNRLQKSLSSAILNYSILQSSLAMSCEKTSQKQVTVKGLELPHSGPFAFLAYLKIEYF